MVLVKWVGGVERANKIYRLTNKELIIEPLAVSSSGDADNSAVSSGDDDSFFDEGAFLDIQCDPGTFQINFKISNEQVKGILYSLFEVKKAFYTHFLRG